jgi:hypothetical protein
VLVGAPRFEPDLIDEIAERGAGVQANRTLTRLGALFRWAMEAPARCIAGLADVINQRSVHVIGQSMSSVGAAKTVAVTGTAGKSECWPSRPLRCSDNTSAVRLRHRYGCSADHHYGKKREKLVRGPVGSGQSQTELEVGR